MHFQLDSNQGDSLGHYTLFYILGLQNFYFNVHLHSEALLKCLAECKQMISPKTLINGKIQFLWEPHISKLTLLHFHIFRLFCCKILVSSKATQGSKLAERQQKPGKEGLIERSLVNVRLHTVIQSMKRPPRAVQLLHKDILTCGQEELEIKLLTLQFLIFHSSLPPEPQSASLKMT